MLTYNFCVTISAAGLELGLSFQGWSIPVQGVPHLSLPTQHRTWDILICTYCIMLSRYRVYRTSPSLLTTEHGTYTVLYILYYAVLWYRVPYLSFPTQHRTWDILYCTERYMYVMLSCGTACSVLQLPFYVKQRILPDTGYQAIFFTIYIYRKLILVKKHHLHF